MISNIAWSIEENKSVCDILNEYGISHLEIAPSIFFNTPASTSLTDILKVKQEWNKRGFHFYAMQSLLFGQPQLAIFQTSQLKKDTFDYLCDIITLAHHLDVKRLVFGSPKNRIVGDLAKETALKIAVIFFKEIAKFAEGKEVIFCLEPNARGYGCDFINDTMEAVELIRMVNSPSFQLNMDTSTLIMNKENINDSIKFASSHIAHVHLSAPYLEPVARHTMNHSEISKILKEINYTGGVSIEMRRAEDGQTENTIRESIKVLTHYVN
jgi:D-psicose/D-tagatose/L-ribulose 3-epimerase